MTSSRPLRPLLALLVLLIGLAAWAFWPGTEHGIRLGLDLRGGTQVILLPQSADGEPITQEALDQTVAILRQRVDGLGVAEAEVTTQGSGDNAAIVVSIPGVTPERIVSLVERTALLDFRPVWTTLGPTSVDLATMQASASANASAAPPTVGPIVPSASPTAVPSPESSGNPVPTATASPSVAKRAASASPSVDATASQGPTTSSSEPPPNTTIVQVDAGGADPVVFSASPAFADFQQKVAALDCTNPAARSGGTPDDPSLWLGACDQSGTQKFILQPAFIRGTNVSGANAAMQQQGVGWTVGLSFDPQGAQALAQASTQLAALPDCGTGVAPCNAFAIVLDGVVVSAPRFNEPILGGQAEISGSFTAQEAKDLANILKYGALPLTLKAEDVSTISATVGNDQLRAGIIAGLLGLGLVVIFLLLYYRVLGIVAVASLVVAAGVVGMTTIVMSKTIGLTLTLAGVAGAIVAIGITADSFIVYFERIRDELREGRSLRQAMDSGWVRARRTLLAADFVSILAAVVLYFLSVGSVRGFAFVLGITTAIDIIVAFWFTHPIAVLLGRSSWMQRGSMLTGLRAERSLGRAARTPDKDSISVEGA